MKWIAPHGAATSTERYRNAQPTIAGSNPDAAFFNTVLDELLAVIVAADMTPTAANLHQIADAIKYLTERAATSGVTKGSYWFGKTTANFTVPNPTLAEQNYIDFTTLKTYSAKSDLSGWTQTGTFVKPVGIDFTILITSKFWDIPEQDGQQGGEAKYNHTDQVWAYWPKIISFQDAALTGTPTAPTPPTGNSSTQIATTKFVSTAISNAANLSLSNLNSMGKNIANWSSNVTNCITEIPQDIKLELNNGTLTLKAGSKVYVPNGFKEDGTTPKFDEIIVESDKRVTSGDNKTHLAFYINGSLYLYSRGTCYSGPTQPNNPGLKAVWYDTTNNLIKRTSDSGSTWTTGGSLPIAVATSNVAIIVQINQVFNGFGYIGSTVFALPGVKGLIPNGRNADGTLNNTSFTTQSVLTSDYYGGQNRYLCRINETSITPVIKSNVVYDEIRNILYFGTTHNQITGVCVGSLTGNASNQIQRFVMPYACRVVDYSDTEYMAHQAMPSDRYVDLTLGASNATYTMPADGFLWLRQQATAVGQYMLLVNQTVNISKTQKSATASGYLADFIPVSKGDIVRIEYTLDSTTAQFKFFYANGAQ